MSICALCRKVGLTRQNYYKLRSIRRERAIDGDLIFHLVSSERRLQPRLGCRKLHHLLRDELHEAGVEIGRDRFINLLRKHDQLAPRLPKAPQTTNSRHSLPVFRNLAADLELTAPNQVWVSDITYIRTLTGFVYLALILDRYSRKIVGYHCGDSLEASGCVRALKLATKDLPSASHPIHHSDRGSQYCCLEYVECLNRSKLPISMTEENHCYENAHAERLNGILKQEYGLRNRFRNLKQARQAVAQAIWLYTHRRPHTSLNMHVPATIHQQAA